MPVSIVDTIPSGQGINVSATTYTHTDVEYDYAINGLPFLSAVDTNHPAIRKTAPYRKQRFDNGTDPGEQSLDFWWIKSQSTFHGGAGQLYIDTPVVQGTEVRVVRYQNSCGVTPWTQGKVSLLQDVTAAHAHSTSATKASLVTIQVSGVNYIVYSDGTAVNILTETVAGTTYTFNAATLGSAFASNIQSVVTDGRYWYATDGNKVQKGDPTLPGTASTVLYTGMGGGTAVLGWLKLALMLGLGNKIYTLDPTASGASLPTATFTHPTTAFAWTACTEGPGAFYFSGYVGAKSLIYKFTLSTASVTPVISGGVVVAELPPGEIVYGLAGYLNTNIGIATSAGVRVGAFGGNSLGDFTYGPLTIQLTTAVAGGAIVGSDRFFFAAYDDVSGLSGVSDVAGLARIDFSQQLSVRPFSYQPDMRFAWAPDLRARTSGGFQAGLPSAVAILPDGRKVFVVSGQNVYVENPNKFTPTGALVTSRIRYDTLDPKIIKYVRTRLSGAAGTVSVQVNQNADSGGPVAILQDLTLGQDTGDVSVNLSKLTFATITFNFASDAGATNSPTLLGYQLKSLPGQTRQRFIQVPLMCYDQETDVSGQRTGGAGQALLRLQQLETLDAAGDVITFQVLSPFPDNEYTTLAVIEDLTFTQISTPTESQGWGGIINLTLRTVSS